MQKLGFLFFPISDLKPCNRTTLINRGVRYTLRITRKSRIETRSPKPIVAPAARAGGCLLLLCLAAAARCWLLVRWLLHCGAVLLAVAASRGCSALRWAALRGCSVPALECIVRLLLLPQACYLCLLFQKPGWLPLLLQVAASCSPSLLPCAGCWLLPRAAPHCCPAAMLLPLQRSSRCCPRSLAAAHAVQRSLLPHSLAADCWLPRVWPAAGRGCVVQPTLAAGWLLRRAQWLISRKLCIEVTSASKIPFISEELCIGCGKLCIEVTPASKIAFISEELCIGCGICVKKCPFEAIQIINLPKDLDKDTTHRYGPNAFKLHRLPVPRPGQVLGLVGTNGIGKSTALKVLAGKLKPNLGRFNNPPDWQEILIYFRGSELQNYFTRILEDNLKAIIKPQYVDHIPKAVQGNVGQVLEQKDERVVKEQLCVDLELNQVLDRNVGDLSGGELQRFAIAVVAIQNAEIYMFDEPSSYLDVKQRLKAAQVVRSLLRPNSYVIVVEHDLSVLDYLSDFICCLYGKPGAYGVVTLPFSVREGINIFLAGFVPTENLRFRDESLTFKVAETPQESAEEIETYARYRYPTMTKTQGNFRLRVAEGEFTDSQIVVMLGENGTGKTTFIRMLAGLLKPDAVEESDVEMPEFNVSYKPQKISPKFPSSVRHLLHQKIRDSYMHPQFVSDVMKPLQIEQLMDQEVLNLSGGELQRVALCLCLGKNGCSGVLGGAMVYMGDGAAMVERKAGKAVVAIAVNGCECGSVVVVVEGNGGCRSGVPADIYLIDEPSAYLDSEQRIVASKVIKRFILHAKKTAFVVEHDFIMATYLADRVIVYEGKPSVDCTANAPQSLLTGMNLFLSHLNITFRRDPTNYRPRINKLDSTKDREQKSAGSYYYLDD
ncbi:RNAse l inhibitor protein 2 [Actinidia rufa]|uniref:RNAse l inhibitor protein 2 n=1 Tax=Actinidia rufa TaxID=165716 RepID=A0A7J0DCK7_9ERIC|nr:RNAse l inhibitor protein 2 [Actinidia rufa]